MLGTRQTSCRPRRGETRAASPVARTQVAGAPQVRTKTQARVGRTQRPVPAGVPRLPGSALRADGDPPSTACHSPARRPLSRGRRRRGRGSSEAPRRPLLPPSPAEPLPDPRGTFGPHFFFLPDFRFPYLVLSHILCAANSSHFRRPRAPGTSSVAVPCIGAWTPTALGDVSKSCRPPRWGNQHVGRFPKTHAVSWSPRGGACTPARTCQGPPLHKTGEHASCESLELGDSHCSPRVPGSGLWVSVQTPAPPPASSGSCALALRELRSRSRGDTLWTQKQGEAGVRWGPWPQQPRAAGGEKQTPPGGAKGAPGPQLSPSTPVSSGRPRGAAVCVVGSLWDDSSSDSPGRGARVVVGADRALRSPSAVARASSPRPAGAGCEAERQRASSGARCAWGRHRRHGPPPGLSLVAPGEGRSREAPGGVSPAVTR